MADVAAGTSSRRRRRGAAQKLGSGVLAMRSTMRLARFATAFALLGAGFLGTAFGAPRSSELVFRVITFNIRFEFPSDVKEGNAWKLRAPMIAALIRDAKASVVCFQEDKTHQVDDLKREMPGWEFSSGPGRDGKASEHCTIAYDAKDWSCVEHGDFWLSDTPDQVASNTWGCKYPHKVSWATLEAIKDSRHRTVTFLSTHLDEHPEFDEVRRKSAVVIRKWVAAHCARSNVIVCGDFNSAVTDPSHKAMLDPEPLPKLTDTFEAACHNEPRPGTVHNFTGKAQTKRIDWIFTGNNVFPRDTRIERWSKDGRYPSDHFAVSAEVEVGIDAGAKKSAPKVEPKTDDKPAVSGAPPAPLPPEKKPPTAIEPKDGVPDETPPSEPGLSPLDPAPPAKKN